MTLDYAKKYLRVDTSDDDELIENLLESARDLCLEILRSDGLDNIPDSPRMKMGILYALSYMYEHREDANYARLKIVLRDLLSASRRAVF